MTPTAKITAVLQGMTPEQINIAIAESIGWKRGTAWSDPPEWYLHGTANGCFSLDGRAGTKLLPDYFADLNRCADFERTLDFAGFQGRQDYEKWIRLIVARDNGLNYDADCAGDFGLITATAIQRCEAYLRVKGLWVEEYKQ